MNCICEDSKLYISPRKNKTYKTHLSIRHAHNNNKEIILSPTKCNMTQRSKVVTLFIQENRLP